MYTSEELLVKVNDFLKTIPGDKQPQSLYEPIRYVLSLGGKRLRPMLMLLSYQLFKDDPQSILSVASGVETYHNYTLLHDDLMDNAPLRRGKPTVHTRWNANTAILSGDSMLVLAYQLVAQCDKNVLPKVLEIFSATALEIGEGQQMDMDFETRNDVKEDEYIEMIRLKTSVLLACAMKLGAILAGANEEDAQRLYRFGEEMGLAFQLQDDYLDVYGDPKVFGKTVGGDIACNKKTFMLINAFNRANAEQRQALQKWIDAENPNIEEKVRAVTQLYNEIGVDKLAEEKIAAYYEQSKKYLDEIQVSAERKQVLQQYAEQLMQRKS